MGGGRGDGLGGNAIRLYRGALRVERVTVSHSKGQVNHACHTQFPLPKSLFIVPLKPYSNLGPLLELHWLATSSLDPHHRRFIVDGPEPWAEWT